LAGCLPEQKLGNRFIEEKPAINIMVLPPDVVLKYNHKGEQIPQFDTLTDAQQDSALWVNSQYIQMIDDSVVLEHYMNSFIGELRTLGFSVYLHSSLDSFMSDRPHSYLLNLAQMQLDEYFYPLEDEEAFDDTVYYKRFDLNAVDFSCWFELSKLNSGSLRKTLLFSSGSAYDDFSGTFMYDPWTGDVKYRYSIDTLQLGDLYDMATNLGKRHASYTFDYFLNLYIAKNLPEGAPMYNYYHYNRFRKTLNATEEDRFEIL
jgi:hypothetical protein